MAQLFPDLDTIEKLNPNPNNPNNKGWLAELACVKFLSNTLSDDFEVYFQPLINGDHPDIIILRKGFGVLIIEVKAWNLDSYYLDSKGIWRLQSNGSDVGSPMEQVKQYKNNLYNLHIPGLAEKKFDDQSYYRFIQTAVYFHEENQKDIDHFVSIKDRHNRYCSLIGRDSLNDHKFKDILNKHWLNIESPIFDDGLYKEMIRFLQPSIHTLEKGKKFNLSNKQASLSISSSNKQQKIKGVAGSGKTFVLARRAVNSHIRHNGRVLILTFNITLKNYIHDHISAVKEEFVWSTFAINNYHNYVRSQMNNLNIRRTLEKYDDLEVFAGHEGEIPKFNSIFIDEIQDYETVWIRIIKKYFLKEGGEFVVFGDEKQNIYGKELDNDKKPNTTIPGQWSTLNESFRLSDKIAKLSTDFQKAFYANKYEIESVDPLNQQEMFIDESITYYNLSKTIKPSTLVDQIFKIIMEKNIHPDDVCILASNIGALRAIDSEIRKHENTKTTFESLEVFDKIPNDGSKNRELEKIRRSKKFNFWMHPGTMKLSTIHSFKGWEISTLFLLISNNSNKESYDELIYTSITRCRHNLIILNIENNRYKDFFENNISSAFVENVKPVINKDINSSFAKEKTLLELESKEGELN